MGWKQKLNSLKLTEHRFNMFQHGLKGVVNSFGILVRQNRTVVGANAEAVCTFLEMTSRRGQLQVYFIFIF